MKTKIIKILLIIILVSGCQKQKLSETPPDIYFNLLEEVEIYSDLKISDIIAETNAEVTNYDYIIDTINIGETTFNINYKYNNKNYVYEGKTNIIDSEQPIIFGSTSRSLLINNNDDLCELIQYGDNHDSNPKCEIIGDYDTSKLGTYDLIMNVTDQSENIASKDVKVNIVEKLNNNSSSNNNRLEFSDVIDKYKTDKTEFGIDVSSWQETIDFVKVKEAGATFVMIRLGFQKGSDRSLQIDNYFYQNIENAKEAGLKVGIYLYSDTGNVNEAKEQALWVCEMLKGAQLDLPIAFDWENWANFNKYKISFYELNKIADAFMKTIETKGYKSMLYSSKYYLESFWQNKSKYPVWLAHYIDQTSYQGDYIIWQLSNIGKIPGINGPVDINIMYK